LRCRACVLATVFVTSVHRAGVDSADAGAGRRSKAAIVLGATGWQTFWYAVTLLTSNGALIYGVILCNARAMGSLARCQSSGHVRGGPTHYRCTWRFWPQQVPICGVLLSRRCRPFWRSRWLSGRWPRWRQDAALKAASATRPSGPDIIHRLYTRNLRS
jgi:hypothetical protein